MQPCLVIRLAYPVGSPHFVDPDSLKVIEATRYEHRYYNRAGKYAGLFWPVNESQFEILRKCKFRVVSLNRLRDEAEKHGQKVEIKLGSPRDGGKLPEPFLALQAVSSRKWSRCPWYVVRKRIAEAIDFARAPQRTTDKRTTGGDMARDEAKVGRWRNGGPSRGPERTGPTSAKKWLGTAVVSALLAAAVGVFGWLAFQVWFATGPRPYFVAFWVGPYDRPEIPPTAWLDADRRALKDDQVFSKADPRSDGDDKTTLEVMQKRLEDLAARPRDEDVVVYLSAYAVVDHDKKIQILAADSVPYEVKTQLPLSWVLDRLKNCPAKNKLLVLDIMRGMIDPRDVGGTADGVGDLLAGAIQDGADPSRLNDPDLMVIAACGPGQVALGSASLRHSVFGYFFHRALTTDEADGDNDGAVSVRELAGYLTRNVDAWAIHYRRVHQSPVLLGRQQGDFVLAATRAPRSPVAPVKAEAADQAQESSKGAETSEARTKELADKDKTKAKDAPADTVESKPAAGKESAYPTWLEEAWTIVERWRKEGDFRAAPRVYRRLAREAIRAELRWRGGEPAGPIQRDLEKIVLELRDAMKKAEEIRQPPARSVGQARAFGRPSDPALRDVLARCLQRRQQLPVDSPDLAKEVKESLAKFKDKTALDLAGALVDAAEGEIFDAKTLAFLDGIVEQSGAPRDVVELQFLHQLARRAREPGPWQPDTARKAWRTVLDAEQANSQPEAFAWVRPQLDEADASLHQARVLLIPQAANYATWKQIAAAWDDARTKYALVAQRQAAIREGRAALSRALAALVSLIPYLEAGPTVDLQTDWLEAADQGGELARKLKPPPGPEPADEGATAALANATARLEVLSRKLMAPFQATAVRAIVERCRTEVPPDPELATQIEAMLLTPFLAVADRRALYEAGRTLEARLEKTWNPGNADGSPATARSVQPGARARRRFERMAAFLKLAGDANTSRLLDEFRRTIEPAGRRKSSGGSDLPWDMSDPASVWSSMARCAELAYGAFVPLLRSDASGDELDRPGWLAPAYIAAFGDRASNPTRRGREQAARDNWTWLAAHYRHESRDLHALMDPDGLLEQAARECPADNPGQPEVPLRIDGPASATRLSPRQRTATVNLELALTGAGAGKPQKVLMDPLEPEDPRLEVSAPEPAAPEVSATAPTTVAMELKLSDDPTRTQVMPPAGLLVRARTPDRRTYHALVPLKIVSTGIDPTLALSRSPDAYDDLPMERLRLRPIAGLRQPFHIFVKNPSDRNWDVIVEILEGDKVVGSSGAKPLTVAAQSSIKVPGFGTPPPKPGDELHELAGPVLRLKDVAGTVLDEQPLRPVIATPADYIEVTRVEFAPAAPGQPNRLTVVLRALPALAGPPCPVELVLPTILNAPKDGILAGNLEPGKPPLTLYAEDFTLKTTDDGQADFYLNVDGVERALWFRSRFPSQVGAKQKATELQCSAPRALVATPKVEQDKDGRPGPARLEVAFEVDDALVNARLEFRLGRSEGGQFQDDLERWSDAAKQRRIGFDPGGEGGSLLFEASIKDWVREWPIRGIRGRRTLQAQLLDETRRNPLSSFETDLVLDDQLPGATSVEVPDRITRGKDLMVRASVTPPASKIKDVMLIFGPKADFEKAVAENRAFKAGTKDPQGREWSATLPVPKDAPAKLVVTARFTTGVGLTAFHSDEVAVIDLPKPEDMKPAAPKRGAIVGTVKEGDRPQPGLKVYLLDPMAPANKTPLLASTDTDAKGAFSFENLEPKMYQIYCQKQDGINNRAANQRVTLEPGKTLKLEMELTK